MGGPEALRDWTGPRRVDRPNPLVRPETRTESAIIRVAFIGRTSTKDQQDPTLSIPRQFRNCTQALPENATIVVCFYDIESGRKDLDTRGDGNAHEMFRIPVPRDGSIQDLLEEAERPNRRFDVVICEEIGRIGRGTYISTKIEKHLEKAGVLLIAADEPFQLDVPRRRAKNSTQVLTRRVKQGVAEWYVLDLLEKSWDGFEIHTEQGYNVGKPPYGYQANQIPHPVPAKRAKGVKKTLLEPHLVEGPVVTKSFGWRVAERLGYQAIADRLNQDPVTNPPPTPIQADHAVGIWTYSNVRDMLTNPKHTGHMVWNRRARKGGGRNRPNPVEEWVWSTEKTHPSLVDLETYVQAQLVAQRRERSRTASENRDPHAKRTYKLRSYLFCVLCGRRLYGKTKRARAYYVCAPKKAWVPEAHPQSTYWVREDSLVDGLTAFLGNHVFGRYRRELLDASLRTIDANAQRDRRTMIAALRRSIADAEAKSKRLVRSLEVTDDVDQEFIRDINERRAELRSQRETLERQLVEAEDEVRRAPNPALLDYLPVTAVDLAEMPDELSRRLFEALRLEIRYDYPTRIATCRVTLLGDTIGVVANTSREAVVIPFPKQKGPAMETQRDYSNGTVCVQPNVRGATESVAPLTGCQRLTGGLSGTVCAVPPAGLEPATK
jgi:site-specific DNA recombinase